MKTGLCILFIFMLFLFPAAVQAQQTVEYAAAVVELWPEFDQPSMLVIYRLVLSPKVSLPTEVIFRIPSRVGRPNAVAAGQADGSLVNLSYDTNHVGEWTLLVFQATTPDLQIEFYDPGLIKTGASRHYEYSWPGNAAVGELSIRVQEPVGARQMRISPSLGGGSTAADGLVYYEADLGALVEGQTFSITVDYEKDTDELSSQSVPIDASGPLNDTTAGRSTMLSALPWVLGAVGVLLIAGGGLWYYFSGRQVGGTSRIRSSRMRKRRKPAPQTPGGVEDGNVYCHQCGRRAVEGDRFCRACGTELRIGSDK
ncbi:MAG: zinc ribbon domain-containing protein [Anaerolineales bacterium]|nr:zinc ribbon domain-containing protein [Anaerolineales bacterium]